MTIELPRELETELKETAQSQGVSVGQYIEKLVAETNLRPTQISEFRSAIAERMASLNAGESVDGEEVMARLINDLTAR
jgi:predicted transcriptional regulator